MHHGRVWACSLTRNQGCKRPHNSLHQLVGACVHSCARTTYTAHLCNWPGPPLLCAPRRCPRRACGGSHVPASCACCACLPGAETAAAAAVGAAAWLRSRQRRSRSGAPLGPGRPRRAPTSQLLTLWGVGMQHLLTIAAAVATSIAQAPSKGNGGPHCPVVPPCAGLQAWRRARAAAWRGGAGGRGGARRRGCGRDQAPAAHATGERRRGALR